MKPIKVAVIGAGQMGKRHVESVRRLPNTLIVAIVDPNESAAKTAAQQLGIDHWYTDYQAMLHAQSPDVVHVCSPNAFHYTICKTLLADGVHVYCEKPLAITAQEGNALTALAQAKGCANGVNFNYRNNAMVRDMRERVLSGDAGRLFLVHGRYLQDWLMYETDYSWRLDSQMNGASRTVADIGSHWFDTVQCITGQKIVRVFAKLITVFAARKKPSQEVETFAAARNATYTAYPVDTEDAGLILVQLQDGTLGSLTLSQISGGHKNDLAVSVDCENYSLYWEQESADRLWIGSRKDGTRLVYASPSTVSGDAQRFATLPEGHAVAWNDALTNGIREFYLAIENDTYQQQAQSYSTFQDGYDIIKIVDACLESNRTDTWITVS